jgi:hypothetical protein
VKGPRAGVHPNGPAGDVRLIVAYVTLAVSLVSVHVRNTDHSYNRKEVYR